MLWTARHPQMLTNAQERRRVEEQYVQGLRKLANRHPPDESSDLGYIHTRTHHSLLAAHH
jgi:hypothetical protein